MRDRAPMVTRPSRTTWAPISAASPIRTSGPITEYGPTRTSRASSAPGSTRAVGWIMAKGRARLLPGRRGLLRLLVERADHVVGDVHLRRGVEHGRPLTLEHHGESLAHTDLLDEAAHVLQHLAEERLLFLLQRPLQIVDEPPRVAHLALQLLLLLSLGVRGQELPLLLDLLAEFFDVAAKRVDLLLHGRLLL